MTMMTMVMVMVMVTITMVSANTLLRRVEAKITVEI